jgi:hypothetical protein
LSNLILVNKAKCGRRNEFGRALGWALGLFVPSGFLCLFPLTNYRSHNWGMEKERINRTSQRAMKMRDKEEDDCWPNGR